jgi:hypothetical protein
MRPIQSIVIDAPVTVTTGPRLSAVIATLQDGEPMSSEARPTTDVVDPTLETLKRRKNCLDPVRWPVER